MNEYRLTIVKETSEHIFFNFFVNGSLSNLNGFVRLRKNDFDQLFKDLFKASRGNCIKAYCCNPPPEFYP
ncbi:MAG: hypothetical protein K6T80_00490 [Firmicutes bacterium]|nr:hypothetical protein [Bacillota bacterium]